MRKFSILAQWAVVFALAILWARALWRPIPPPDYDPDGWAAWRGFHAVSYAGVTREGGGDYVTPRRLASHLRALRDAGYRTIAPEDAEAFLQGRAPLPDKAVLLMFEGGRRDSYLAATPLLREFGLIAAMCVPTETTRRWSRFYLRNRDLKNFAGFAHWRLMSMGHAAALPFERERGEQGRFLTQRRAVNGRAENDEEFRARIEDDFARAAAILSKATRRPIAGYLFPFADAGTSRNADPRAAAFIREALAKHHRIAFSRADGAFNGPDSDPFQLTRIRVRGDWDARTLMDELDGALPSDEPIPNLGDLSRWSADGNVRTTSDGLLLEPGARAWARGSADWSNFECAFRVKRPPGGAFALYARYAGPACYIRVRFDDDGLRVQERAETGMRTLAFFAATNGAPTEGAFTLRVKGNRLWLTAPNLAIEGPLTLSRQSAQGRLGFEADGASATLAEFAARQIPGLLVRASHFRALPAQTRDSMTMWSPPWFDLRCEPRLTTEMREDLLAADENGIMIIPRVIADTAEDAPPGPWADALARVFSEIAAPRTPTRLAVPAGRPLLHEALRLHGFALMQEFDRVQMPPRDPEDRLAREGDWVLIDRRAQEEWRLRIPASRIFSLHNNEREGITGAQRAIEVDQSRE